MKRTLFVIASLVLVAIHFYNPTQLTTTVNLTIPAMTERPVKAAIRSTAAQRKPVTVKAPTTKPKTVVTTTAAFPNDVPKLPGSFDDLPKQSVTDYLETAKLQGMYRWIPCQPYPWAGGQPLCGMEAPWYRPDPQAMLTAMLEDCPNDAECSAYRALLIEEQLNHPGTTEDPRAREAARYWWQSYQLQLAALDDCAAQGLTLLNNRCEFPNTLAYY